MDYTWVLLSLGSAFSLATSDVLVKKTVEDSDEYMVAWLRLVFTLPLLLIIGLFVPVPALDREFYLAFFLALPVELLTIILYVKALKVSPMSLTLPFLALTPVVLIISSYLILGEKVSASGGTGIFLIASGSYILNIREVKKGILGPFEAIKREKGSVLMICVALCYSITASLGKMAIEHSSPLFFGITYYIALSFLFAPVAIRMGRGRTRTALFGNKFVTLMMSGFFNSLMVMTHMTAMKLTKVAYMVSVKRTSLLIGVLYGYLFFREEGIRERFLGAALMFAGFVMVVTAK